jgi:predicted DNA-binding protein (MmcQ/YjbR family)
MDSIMDIELLRAYLLKKKEASEEFPFGPEVMVFKVRGKMFALVFLEDSPLSINLKCDPDLAMHLREFYNAVQPGYHMNKNHWNTIILDGSVPEDEIFTMINESYDLVVKGLKKTDKKMLGKLSEN